jgi:hypothetical protein
VKLLSIALALAFVSSEAQADTVPPNLTIVAWTLGSWTCSGSYRDVPPLITAHPVLATFRITIEPSLGDWITARYAEIPTAENPAPVSLVDLSTVDPTGAGVRVFASSGGLRSWSTFVPDPDAIAFIGTYNVFGLSFGFAQIVARHGDKAFTSTSSIDVGSGLQVLQTLTCLRI